LRERIIAKLATMDLRPQTLAAKVPFVVLVIGSLGLGLGATLWLSTDSAERSYQLSTARGTTRALSQQKESLERDVLEAQSAPALAEAARSLGMIPSRDTAHLVQDPAGNWIVVGQPKPAAGAPPPPLNSKLPDPTPAPKPVNRTEVPVRLPAPGATPPAAPGATPPAAPAGPEVMVRTPAPDAVQAPGAAPGPVPVQAPGAAPGPVPDQAPAPVQAPPPPDAPQPTNPPTPPVGGEQFTGVAPQTAGPPA
jgi:hypothetical protein